MKVDFGYPPSPNILADQDKLLIGLLFNIPPPTLDSKNKWELILDISPPINILADQDKLLIGLLFNIPPPRLDRTN